MSPRPSNTTLFYLPVPKRINKSKKKKDLYLLVLFSEQSNQMSKPKFPVSIIYLFIDGYFNSSSQNVRHVMYYPKQQVNV